jgi:energy-coupling factor transporter ATP-binding protein EcfA2
MKLISISGLDGSGKSTQIKMLKAYLENRDKKIFYFHAIQFGVAEKIKKIRQKYCLLCLLKKKCQADRKSSSSTESVTESGKLGIWLRKIFLRIDICRFGKLVEKLEKEGYDYLLTDRYFNDIIVNIEYLIGGEASKRRPRLQKNRSGYYFLQFWGAISGEVS